MNIDADVAASTAIPTGAPSSFPDFPLLNHYSILIYPFFHDITPDNRKRQIQQLEGIWSPWWARKEGSLNKTLDDTYFFLPYIREIIFPETALLKNTPPGDQYSNWVTKVRRWSDKNLNYYCCDLPNEAVLRLTYRRELLSTIESLEVLTPSPDGMLKEGELPPIRLEWVDAILFPSGIGFLMLKLVLNESPPQMSHLVDLNYYLRMVHPPAIGWRLAELRIKGMAYSFKFRDLTDFLTQGVTDTASIIPDFTQFIEHLRLSNPRRYSETEAGQVYGERCHSFSYACVNVDEDAPAEAQEGDLSRKDRLLFEFASSIQIGRSQTDPMWVPSPEQVSRMKEQNRVSVWKAWRGMALKESVVFLGTEDIPFNRNVLSHNVEHDYLPLYLYSLYQKYQLFIFADELMRKGAYVAQHLQEVRKLMDRFMDFRNKYWFNEVTRKPLGGELYRKFQQGLESTLLYEMVSSQVKDLKEYYEEQQQRRIGVLLNLFTFAFLPLGAVIGVFGMTFFEGNWPLFIAAFLIVGMISLGLWKWWTQEGGPRDE